MTDDEEDSTAKLTQKKKRLVIAHLIFAHSTKPDFAAVLSCQ